MPTKDRQQRYRQRQRTSGRQRLEVWIDRDTADLLEHLIPQYPAPSRSGSLSLIIPAAFRLLTSVTGNFQPATSSVTGNFQPATSSVTGNFQPATSSVTGNFRSKPIPDTGASRPGRYMSQDLEDRILAMRQQGMSLQQVSAALANTGILGNNGQPFRTGTLSKAETRARCRLNLSN